MADRKLTRNQRRQIDKLAPHVHRILNADIAFFEQHPDRRYRVRFANDAEIAHAEVLEDHLLQVPQGCCWLVIVKKVPGANVRKFVASDPTLEGNTSGDLRDDAQGCAGRAHGGDRHVAMMAAAASKILKAFAIQVETLRRLRAGGS
jgi:hypothetical protein